MHELAAWILFPLVALAICTGVGLLAARLARADLDPAALPAVGFCAAIAVLGPLFATGAGEWWGLGLLTALAIAGFASGASAASARLRPGPGSAAGIAAYALHIAPIALSGTATFLGYNLLNDTALHLALVDWIGDHGSKFIEQAPSSYGATINDYVRTRYPLGGHELLAALRPITGLDAAAVYQPFIAVCAGIAAAAITVVVRVGADARGGRATAWIAAAVGFAALAGQLVFSFTLQGGIKEIGFVVCLAAAAAVGVRRAPVLLALPAAAMYAIYGVYALPWVAPLALVALWLLRPPPRQVALATGVFVLLTAVSIEDSIDYYNHGHTVITSGAELGPLAGPLSVLQAAGIWLNGDYRFRPDPHAWLTYGLIALALLAAAYGAYRALRERAAGPLLLVIPALVATLVTAPSGSPYIDAKLLMILSPAIVVAAALGVTAIPVPRLALAAAVVLGAGLLVSDGLAYRMAIVAPADRLDELGAIDERYAGQGPILVNEYEQYTKHFMRKAPGSDPYEPWTAARAEPLDPSLPVAAQAYDLDQLKPEFVQRWRLIALRRSPAASRPPGNYQRDWSGRFYEVWRKRDSAPLLHDGLGSVDDPTAPLGCDLTPGTAAALRPKPRIVAIDRGPLPPGWVRQGSALSTNKGGVIAASFEGSGPARVWLKGRAFRKLELRIDGRTVGSARGLNGPNQWLEVGRVDLAAGPHRLEIERPTRSLRPGDAQRDVIGPVALVPEAKPRLVGGMETQRACGAPADWTERY